MEICFVVQRKHCHSFCSEVRTDKRNLRPLCRRDTMPPAPQKKTNCRRQGWGEVDRGGLAHGDAGLHAGL
jgi:hypothetical protein